MYEELHKKASKKVKAKMAFYTCTIVFSFVTIILIMLSFYLPGEAFWLRLPIPVFVMVLCLLYLSAFGLPTNGALSEDWQEDEIEKEMIRLYRKHKGKLPPAEELSETDKLELKKLEKMQENKDWGEKLV